MTEILLVYLAMILLLVVYCLCASIKRRGTIEDEYFHEAWHSILLRWMFRCAKLIAAIPAFFAYGVFFANGNLFTINGIFLPIASSLTFYVFLRLFMAFIYQKYMSIRKPE